MRDNIIKMHLMKETTNLVLTDAYEFRPVGRLAFLQKWMWKLLKKMQALHLYYDSKIEVKRIEFREDDFIKRLQKHYIDCFPRTQPKKIYMGPEEFQKLSSYNMETLMSVGFTFNIGMRGYSVFNVEVEVIPYMQGVLII